MGRIWWPRIEAITTLSETVGYKSGLALTRREITKHLPEYRDTLSGNADAVITIRSETFEEMVGDLLYQLGNVASPGISFPVIDLYHKYKQHPAKLKQLTKVLDLFHASFPAARRRAEKTSGPIDLTPFVRKAEKRFGVEGAIIALEFVKELRSSLQKNPWSMFRRVEWVDITELADLFKSEKLATYYGYFFDQRYIDYLYRNFDSIDKINWRKFEGLTGEFFAREGFHVEMSRGRNDGGIDARVWPEKENSERPPTILVQCKRQKEKVGKVIVKALWADVVNEKAQAGLVVTTSTLSPGAKKVCTARSYPVTQANRETLQKWVNKMRSPNSGVFLGR